MAKSHKKKGKKHRSKTTLPPVKEGSKQNGAKVTRSNSIPPANQQKQHRKRISVKKVSVSKFKSNATPLHEGTNTERIPKTTPSSTSIIDAFSSLSLNEKEKRSNKKQSKRRFSTDTTSGKNDSRKDKSKRQSLEDIAKLITTGKAKNIVIMAGAGISTDSGIPDFRTPGTGLYDNLKKYKIPSPTAIFDLDYFHHDPKPFFALAKELYPSGKYKPCIPHYFVKLLQEKGLLLRMYTQNIDGLERIAGIPSEKLVEAHGTFATASCTRCGKKHDGLEIKNKVLSGIMPRCSSSGLCWGIVKPDIVFFGEDLPRRFYYYLKDFPSCDLLIIMGTSLEVEPFASLTSSVRFNCPRLLLNRELVGPFKKRSHGRSHDVGITGDLAETVGRFANLLGWQEELDELIETSKLEEAIEGKSDSGSTDSGVSSSESLTEPTKRHPNSLLPPDNDIKRYFHTVRSTPLPKSKSTHTESSNYSGSYYKYIRDKTFPPPPQATDYTIKSIIPGMYSTSSLPIQYAQTVRSKKRNKVTTFGAGTFDMTLQKPNKNNFDSSDSDSSSEDNSGSTDTLSTLTSDDSSS